MSQDLKPATTRNLLSKSSNDLTGLSSGFNFDQTYN